MSQRTYKLLICVSFGALAFGATPQAVAAPETGQGVSTPPDTNHLTDIVVTAQRRTQRLQDVGVAVTAVSSDQMRQLGIVQSKDIAKVAPGVLFDSTGGGGVNANLTVRGISQSDFSSVQESPNSIYLDDVYISSPNAAAFTLYDMQRIEVLRGPQGTLFGRASSGGLVNFIVAKPTRDLTGYLEAGYSRFNDKYAEGAVSGPISDDIRFRISGRRETSDGWFLNGTPGGSNAFQKDFYGVRFQLEANVTRELTARFSFSYDANPYHHEGAYRAVPAYLVNGQPAKLPADVDAYGTGAGNDFFGDRNPYSQFNKGNFTSSAGFLQNHRLSPTLYLTDELGGGATLTSITNYTRFFLRYSEDDDGGSADNFNSQLNQKLDQWSQEVRLNGKLGRLTYTTGFYYLNARQHSPQGTNAPTLAGTPFGFDILNDVRQNVHSWALFGQAEYKLTNTLSATVGARYTNERKAFSSQAYFSDLGSGYGGPGISEPPLLAYDFSKNTVGDLARQSEGLWSGKVQLDYKPGQNMLFYVSASRGVKAAGFNTNAGGTTTIDQTPFKSEYVYAYEGGSKLELLDRHLRVNTSVFYYDYHRFQGFSFSGLSGVVGNYNGYFDGGEIEITAAPRSDIDISLSGSRLTTKLHDVSTAYSGVRDEQSIMAPRWTANASVTKRFTLPFGTLALNWNGNYIDHRYASIDNNPATYLPGSFIHNARITLTLPSKGVEIALFVDNISNTARRNFSFDLTTSVGDWLQSYAPPRIFGGSIRKTF